LIPENLFFLLPSFFARASADTVCRTTCTGAPNRHPGETAGKGRGGHLRAAACQGTTNDHPASLDSGVQRPASSVQRPASSPSVQGSRGIISPGNPTNTNPSGRTNTRIPFGDYPLKVGKIQRRLAWPPRKDDAHKPRDIHHRNAAPSAGAQADRVPAQCLRRGRGGARLSSEKGGGAPKRGGHSAIVVFTAACICAVAALVV